MLRLDVGFCRQIEQLRRCEIIKESEVKVLCAKARYAIPGLSMTCLLHLPQGDPN